MSDGEGSSSNVVFLAHRGDGAKVDTEWRENLACRNCRNKTFAVEYDLPREECGFPMLRCGCCGSLLGRIGWVPEEP